MTPEKIYTALTTGVMQQQASALNDAQKKGVAEFMAGRPMGSAKSGGIENMGFQCRTNPPLPDPASRPAWNGWSPDLANTRFQPANVARLTSAQVPKLKLKWAFGFPSGVSANAQPTVAAGRVFVGSDNGYVYSVDAKTGCVYWSFETGSIIRDAITVGAVRGNGDAKYAAFVGDGQQWQSRLLMLHVARFGRRTGREHRQANLESVGHPRRAKALQDDGERRRVVRAGWRCGVEFPDDRSN